MASPYQKDAQNALKALEALEVEKLKPGVARGIRPSNNLGNKTQDKARHELHNPSAYEDAMVNALDELEALKRVMPIVAKIAKKKIPLEQAFKEVSGDAFIMLLKLAFSEENSKVQADVLKHIMALAGFNPAQKHEISKVDPDTPKEALINLIAGAQKDLAAENIEIVDDRDDEVKDVTEDTSSENIG
jgi:hypothetical protein